MLIYSDVHYLSLQFLLVQPVLRFNSFKHPVHSEHILSSLTRHSWKVLALIPTWKIIQRRMYIISKCVFFPDFKELHGHFFSLLMDLLPKPYPMFCLLLNQLQLMQSQIRIFETVSS